MNRLPSQGEGVYYAAFMRGLRPVRRLGVTLWANSYRYMSEKASALPGKYSVAITPYLVGIHAALDDPKIYKIVCMKGAQVAWTDGVLNNYIGSRIDVDPCAMVLMFPKEGAAKEYNQEKFIPMVDATPRLQDKVSTKATTKENRQLFKSFPGGFLKMVGSNSTSSVKSTPAPVVMVEEPDDCNLNIKGQGDAIKLLEERTKTFPRRKIIFGGTPAVKGVSTIEQEYKASDQRKHWVPCHECEEFHVLSWDHVHWDSDSARNHEIYGTALPESAYYACPHCGSVWDDERKNQNVELGEWRAGAEFRGVAGFHISELYSGFPGSNFQRLVERYLEAKYTQERGDDTEMIVFVNACLGNPYEVESDAPETEVLEARALDYPEKTVAEGGLVLTAGIDVQHDRLAVVIRAWGVGEESWLVFWGEIYGATTDKSDAVWDDLDSLLFDQYRHARGVPLKIAASSIDSSDGATSDAVYHHARRNKKRGVMAIKGASIDYGQREIYSKPPVSVDEGRKNKAAKYGLRPYIVGTSKAKDLIASRVKLDGQGPGRMHWYREVRGDYLEQLTAEVKVPAKSNPRKRVWQLKAGARNEGLDCEVYALHAARHCKTHLMTPAAWGRVEGRIFQVDLFGDDETLPDMPPPEVKKSGRRVRDLRRGRV